MRRLRAAGAVIVGKTNVPELEITPFTETPTFGATRNPWDLNRTPGGSSGGSAAGGRGRPRRRRARLRRRRLDPHPRRLLRAVRPQAAARPRSRWRRMHEPWHGLSVYGPIARHVADAALFLDATGDGEPLAPAVGARRPAACGSRSRRSRHAADPRPRPDAEQRGALDDMAASCCAASATTSASAEIPTTAPTGVGVHRPLLRAASHDEARARCPTPSGCRAAPRASSASGSADPARRCSSARAPRRPPTRARSPTVFEQRRRPA